MVKPKWNILGFWVTHEGNMPLNKNVESIMNMMPQNSQKGVFKFIELVNYYLYTWANISHTLQPLTRLVAKNMKSKWTEL